MSRRVLLILLAALPLRAESSETSPPAKNTLAAVRRIYVSQLTGDSTADALHDLIIAALDGARLFVITENPDHADAVLKGAGGDTTFEDTFDSSSSLNTRSAGGRLAGKGSLASGRLGGGSLSSSAGDNDSHHIKERKHQAYATVRLVNTDGDVLWSTTQESPGAKFRGASADVAAKIARQLALDYENSRRPASIPTGN